MLIAKSVDLQTYQEKPDYARCVSIVASASLREMIKPGALAVISPIVIGKSLLQFSVCLYGCFFVSESSSRLMGFYSSD